MKAKINLTQINFIKDVIFVTKININITKITQYINEIGFIITRYNKLCTRIISKLLSLGSILPY